MILHVPCESFMAQESSQVPVNKHMQGREQLGESQSPTQLQKYDLFWITEAWWDSPCDWRAATDGHRLFRKDRLEGVRSGGALCRQVPRALPWDR